MRHNLILLLKNLLLSLLMGLPSFVYFISQYLVATHTQAAKAAGIVLIAAFYVVPIFSYFIYPARRLQLISNGWKRFFLHLIFLVVSSFVYMTIMLTAGKFLTSHIA